MLRWGLRSLQALQPCAQLGHRIRVGVLRDPKGRLVVEKFALQPEIQMHSVLRKHVQKSRPVDKTDRWKSTNSISVSQPEFQHSLGAGPRQNCHTIRRLPPEPGAEERSFSHTVVSWVHRSWLAALRVKSTGRDGGRLSGITPSLQLACSWKSVHHFSPQGLPPAHLGLQSQTAFLFLRRVRRALVTHPARHLFLESRGRRMVRENSQQT